jgi:hypothetical protein
MDMSRLLRAVGVLVILIGVTVAPALVFAQHGSGGFHGGTGFHAGGVHYGGAGYGWHGAYGWHGGYAGRRGYGWHGYWAYPHYASGWGISIGFNWSYPYAYGYRAWIPGPYYYSYAPYYQAPFCYGPCGYVRCCSSDDTGDPQDEPPLARKPTSGESVSRPETKSETRLEPGASTSRPARPSPQEMSSYRRPVQNAIRALLAMPPDARRRQLQSTRYANFSAGERALLAQVSLPAESARQH